MEGYTPKPIDRNSTHSSGPPFGGRIPHTRPTPPWLYPIQFRTCAGLVPGTPRGLPGKFGSNAGVPGVPGGVRRSLGEKSIFGVRGVKFHLRAPFSILSHNGG